MNFDHANKAAHAVEQQWHYPILTTAGYTALTRVVTGLVRSYTYHHPGRGAIECTTGASADYWEEKGTGKGGYWATLAHIC